MANPICEVVFFIVQVLLYINCIFKSSVRKVKMYLKLYSVDILSRDFQNFFYKSFFKFRYCRKLEKYKKKTPKYGSCTPT